ncbi:2-dehydropantoate 2-reductase [Nocardioides oleivorans]|uniref:2-dehydropantoate 2-reductase n=1 Tax=Nocardioides oleivorans TaxID=273676 RepID=A0A4Q2RZ68_9ACTN|nr:2-dehydropantoate 2-reductase [Nocardioides oleivorans]RYB93314.1 2-dehydropantoate 2-reductase [Nocardioides oleivorans]
MRYVVIGAGAVGGVIGARLALAGVDVTLVARGPHLDAIRSRGLVVESAAGREVAEVVAVGSPAEVDWAQDHVVLLCVKGQQTVAALEDLVASAPPETPVVSVQNGVANERELLRRFERTYGITVMQPCAHLEPGVVVQQCHPIPGLLDIGRYPAGVDDVCTAVSQDLQRAGFESVPRPDIMAWKHRKLVLNLANAVQACFAPSPAADELQVRVRAEGEAVLAAAGIPVVTEEQDAVRRGDKLQGRQRPDAFGSTWQSLTRGTGDVETDLLNGEVVLLGRLHGVPVPANAALQRVSTAAARDGVPPRSLDASELLAAL